MAATASSGTIAGNIANEDCSRQLHTVRAQARGLSVPRQHGQAERRIQPGHRRAARPRQALVFPVRPLQLCANNYVTGMFHNENAGNPNAWTYEADPSRPATSTSELARVSGAASPGRRTEAQDRNHLRHEENLHLHDSNRQRDDLTGSRQRFNFPLQRFVQVDWSSPVTNRLLIEASGIHRVERWGGMHLQSGAGDVAVPDERMIGVNEQTTGLNYRAAPGGFLGAPPFNNSWNVNLHYRAAMSYITGSHQVKVGFNNAWGHHENTPYALNPYSYVFAGGRPLQIRQWAIPYTTEVDVDADLGHLRSGQVDDRALHDRGRHPLRLLLQQLSATDDRAWRSGAEPQSRLRRRHLRRRDRVSRSRVARRTATPCRT